MSSDSDEEAQAGKTWISVRGLKHAADIKTVYRPHHEEDPSSSPHSSLNSSVTAEAAANPVIHVSPSFSNLHESYMTEEGTEGRRWVAHSRDSSASTNKMHTRRPHEEVYELQQELLQTQRELQRLQVEQAKRDQHYVLQLQMIQAHHERKMQRSRHDLEELLRQQPRKQVEAAIKQVKEEYDQEFQRICNKYEEEIEQLKAEHELELLEKEEECEKAMSELHSVSREKYKSLERSSEDREQELVRKYQSQIDKIEKRHKAEIQQLNRGDIKSPEKSPEINKFRRYPKLEIQTDFSTLDDRKTLISKLESELIALKRKTEDQEVVIKTQETALEELKSHLSAAFRKRASDAKSPHISRIGILDMSDELGNSQGLESELKQIISQIE